LILQCIIKNNKHRLGGTFMVKATYKSRETKTTDITPEFTAGRLTNYGGLVPFAAFLGETLPFQEVLDQQLQLGMGPNCTYSDWQIFTLIIFGYLCGQDRLAHFEQLSLDSTVQKLLALDSPI